MRAWLCMDDWWTRSLLVCGGIISIADGFTRAPNTTWEMETLNPLQYQPYIGAFVFAAVSLVLMEAYGLSYKLPRREVIVLWFIFCTASYTKDFAYLRIPGTPIFVTDMLLVLCIVSAWRQLWRVPPILAVGLISFWTVGIIACVHGLWEGRSGILILRDCTLVGYSLYLLVGLDVFRTWESVRRALFWFLAGTVMSCFNGLAWFVAAPAQRRVILYGVYTCLAFVGSMTAMVDWRNRQMIRWPVFLLLYLGLILSNMRTLFLGVGVGLVLIVLGGRYVYRCYPLRPLARWMAVLLLGSVVVLLASQKSAAGKQFLDRVAAEQSSGLFHASQDTNVHFRLLAWDEAFRRFLQSPLMGEGFGAPFIFSLADTDLRPHNTYLTVLYKMGITGIISLLGLLFYLFQSGIRALAQRPRSTCANLLFAVLVVQFVFCTYGLANLLLESPFLASVFWIGMALNIRMARLLLVVPSAVGTGCHSQPDNPQQGHRALIVA